MLDSYTQQVQEWLEQRFSRDAATNEYCGHQPIYGFGRGNSEPGHLVRFARTFKLLQLINCLEFESVLDVGGGEGYLAHHIRDQFGAIAVNSDLSAEANRRAAELYGLPGISINASQLPFKTQSFDLVVCSEVLEHVEQAVDAILELDRIAKKYVIITTLEACPSRWERWLKLRLRDFSHPHYEVNWWHSTDFVRLLGQEAGYTAQICTPGSEISEHELSESQAKMLVQQMAQKTPFGTEGTWGILVWKKKSPMRSQPVCQEQQLLNSLFADKVQPKNLKVAKDEFDVSLLTYLCCPVCLSSLIHRDNTLICSACGDIYQIKHGIPLMYPDRKRTAVSEPQAAAVLRRTLRMDNIATNKHERALLQRVLKIYYAYRAFRDVSLTEKAKKITRRLFSYKN